MTQSNQQGTPMTPQERQEKANKWGQEQVVKIQKFCFSSGIEFKGFKQEKCVNLPPVIAIWYIQSKTKNEDYWAISGEFPTDIAPVKVAKDARDATRYFALSWQLKAARMEDSLAEGKVQLGDKETQQKAIAELIQKAEMLADIHRDEQFWVNTNLKIA